MCLRVYRQGGGCKYIQVSKCGTLVALWAPACHEYSCAPGKKYLIYIALGIRVSKPYLCQGNQKIVPGGREVTFTVNLRDRVSG